MVARRETFLQMAMSVDLKKKVEGFNVTSLMFLYLKIMETLNCKWFYKKIKIILNEVVWNPSFFLVLFLTGT